MTADMILRPYNNIRLHLLTTVFSRFTVHYLFLWGRNIPKWMDFHFLLLYTFLLYGATAQYGRLLLLWDVISYCVD